MCLRNPSLVVYRSGLFNNNMILTERILLIMVYKLQLKNNNQNFNSREQFLHLYLRNTELIILTFVNITRFKLWNQGNKV